MNKKAQISIIMGSTSDLPVMKKAMEFLESMEIFFEINALSAHRTPDEVSDYAKKAKQRGIKVIIAGAGGAAHLPGVIAANTVLPVIGVPIKSEGFGMDGWDSLLSIVSMPSGIPVATVGANSAQNAAILATQILALSDEAVNNKIEIFKNNLKIKIENANKELNNINNFNFLCK